MYFSPAVEYYPYPGAMSLQAYLAFQRTRYWIVLFPVVVPRLHYLQCGSHAFAPNALRYWVRGTTANPHAILIRYSWASLQRTMVGKCEFNADSSSLCVVRRDLPTTAIVCSLLVLHWRNNPCVSGAWWSGRQVAVRQTCGTDTPAHGAMADST